jgi:hypothetical protein
MLIHWWQKNSLIQNEGKRNKKPVTNTIKPLSIISQGAMEGEG